MSMRTIVLAAVVAAPMAWLPAPASAQAQGRDNAAQQSAQGQASGAGKAFAKGRPTQLPPGIEKHLPAGALPPGIARTRPQQPADEPVTQEVQTDTTECAVELVFTLDGPMYKDCNGNLTAANVGG